MAATNIGNTKVASAKTCIGEDRQGYRMIKEELPTLTDSAAGRILPQETASSGLAPESEPSNSCPVFSNFKVKS